MASITAPLLDIMQLLTKVDGIKHCRVWNNQVKYEKEGKSITFPKPAVFVEVVNNVQFNQLGVGFQSADIGWRLHLVHDFYDAQDGTFEQDMEIFKLRDKVVLAISLFEPTACGPLTKVAETQDYEHDNVYEYIIEYTCNFIDSKGSPYDEDSPKLVEKDPPTTLIVNAQITNTL